MSSTGFLISKHREKVQAAVSNIENHPNHDLHPVLKSLVEDAKDTVLSIDDTYTSIGVSITGDSASAYDDLIALMKSSSELLGKEVESAKTLNDNITKFADVAASDKKLGANLVVTDKSKSKHWSADSLKDFASYIGDVKDDTNNFKMEYVDTLIDTPAGPLFDVRVKHLKEAVAARKVNVIENVWFK